jgi:hypothetical protein
MPLGKYFADSLVSTLRSSVRARKKRVFPQKSLLGYFRKDEAEHPSAASQFAVPGETARNTGRSGFRGKFG